MPGTLNSSKIQPVNQETTPATGPVIKGALRQLPQDSRLAVYLAYVEGLACREIAEVTGAPIETVTRWLRCGRRQLRWLLRDHAARKP
jgi:RNA polymerase sigma-70 factor (ECF subfamily)